MKTVLLINGEKTIVEYNDITGFSGFPEDINLEVSKTVKSK